MIQIIEYKRISETLNYIELLKYQMVKSPFISGNIFAVIPFLANASILRQPHYGDYSFPDRYFVYLLHVNLIMRLPQYWDNLFVPKMVRNVEVFLYSMNKKN